MRLVSTLAAAALLTAAPAFAALAPGAKAPDFTTRGAIAGKVFTVHLAEQLKKGPVVLYFFPAAYTGGCTPRRMPLPRRSPPSPRRVRR